MYYITAVPGHIADTIGISTERCQTRDTALDAMYEVLAKASTKEEADALVQELTRPND